MGKGAIKKDLMQKTPIHIMTKHKITMQKTPIQKKLMPHGAMQKEQNAPSIIERKTGRLIQEEEYGQKAIYFLYHHFQKKSSEKMMIQKINGSLPILLFLNQPSCSSLDNRRGGLLLLFLLFTHSPLPYSFLTSNITKRIAKSKRPIRIFKLGFFILKLKTKKKASKAYKNSPGRIFSIEKYTLNNP